MTTVPSNLRHNRALIEALVRERDEAAGASEKWAALAAHRGLCGENLTNDLNKRTSQFWEAVEQRDIAYAHPFRNLWAWLKRKVSR